jgi:hypothetical protein
MSKNKGSKKPEDNEEFRFVKSRVRINNGDQPIKEGSLIEFPESQMTLYGYKKGTVKYFFDTEEQRQEYIDKYPKDIALKLFIVDFIGDMADRYNVIKYTENNGKPKFVAEKSIAFVDVYNEEESNKTGEFIWDMGLGSYVGISDIHTAFKLRGIELHQATYCALSITACTSNPIREDTNPVQFGLSPRGRKKTKPKDIK